MIEIDVMPKKPDNRINICDIRDIDIKDKIIVVAPNNHSSMAIGVLTKFYIDNDTKYCFCCPYYTLGAWADTLSNDAYRSIEEMADIIYDAKLLIFEDMKEFANWLDN